MTGPLPGAHMGQRGAVEPLGSQHVGVVDVPDLFGHEGLGRSGHHVPGVVEEHVDAALLGDDGADCLVDRAL